ncbi:lipoprotein [Mycoplasma mycoides subsp. capri]|uniref:Ig-specific serine endopeptidase MIP n=1 Tax=Mycoplasma mycoides TaxID=2102 RepID=UPI00223EE9A7|nr:lipoprotein [Mycoplasma mycoides]QVJ95984.1 lipoprotein [Mycoplasma mycoides subsp. capri]QVJ96876.1 lipoprotein [Mycoplasma mycoides subsp. capri]QVJ99918.1 lipoprotein [Mycoplasma mycoides subsp. capri]QVK00740.1 lipoprotein [Mycoplasma mycoides subsp. capri]
MKRVNKLLVLLSSTTLTLPLTLLVACTSTKQAPKSIDDTEFLKVVDSIQSEEDLLKYADLKFKDSRGSYISKGDVIPSQLEKNQVEITFKGNYKGQIRAEVTTVNNDPNNNGSSSSVRLYVEFKNNKTGKAKSINFVVSGLNEKGVVDPFRNSSVNTISYFDDAGGFESYSNKNQKDRFKYDNEKYINSLEGQISPDKKPINLKTYRGLETSEDNIKKFDQKASESNFDTYYNAALKGFTLPVYDNEGKVKGLQINDGPEINKGASTVDSLGRDRFKTNGLARTIPNETYKTAAIQTFQVSFTGYKDYAAEIEEAEDNIALFKSWDDNRIKIYIDTQLDQLRRNYEDESQQIEKQLQSTDKSYTSILDKLNKQKEKLKADYEKDLNQISKLGKDGLVKWQEEQIQEYKKKKELKQFQTSEAGTMWIMDYLTENGGKKPTKFYFGTNSHVAKALKDDLLSVSLTRLNSNISVGQTFNLNGYDKNFTKFVFTPKNNKKLTDAITTIFHATDFIKEDKSPLKFLEPTQKDKYKGAGIFADFAVIEIDFEKLLNNSEYTHTVWSESKEITSSYENKQDELISNITNDYAGNNSKKVQFVSDSLLDKTYYDKYDRKLDFDKTKFDEVEAYKKLESLYIVGYPTANEDYYLDQYEDHTQLSTKKYDFSLWVNSESKYYKKLANKEGHTSSFSKDELEKGNFLSYQIGYRSFIDKPGLTDGFLAAHRVGKKLYRLNEKTNGQSKKYFNYGLEILPRFYAPAGGASGSSVRTKDNKLLAVYHAANNVAKTGLAATFRSNGYNYNGLFGEYNLGQYDLIYGGGSDQASGKSYREVMKVKYSSGKSALFDKGFDHTPEEFKFKPQAR